jgi:phosphoribosylformylglycinamidine synthase
MSKKKIGILVFPGSNCDRDCQHVFARVYRFRVDMIWHQNSFDPHDYSLIVLPGGFSYGDYLRAGAISRFATSMQSVEHYAQKNKPILGICNGFQILCEAGLLPGALVMNRDLLFKSHSTPLKGQNPGSKYLQGLEDKEFSLPIAHGEGNYVIDEEGYQRLLDNEQIIIKYLNNPNGSYQDIAGITNQSGNIMGMMPHPERASEAIMGSQEGRLILDPITQNL